MARKLLIVDDSAAVRQSISYVLEQAGYEIEEASDGMDGVGKLEEGSFDLIITDINMPNLDGIGFLGKIREHPLHRFVPVLVLTTESQGSKMEEGKAAGATGWIVKPFSAVKLQEVVRKLIR